MSEKENFRLKEWFFAFGKPLKSSLLAQYAREHKYIHLKNI